MSYSYLWCPNCGHTTKVSDQEYEEKEEFFCWYCQQEYEKRLWEVGKKRIPFTCMR